VMVTAMVKDSGQVREGATASDVLRPSSTWKETAMGNEGLFEGEPDADTYTSGYGHECCYGEGDGDGDGSCDEDGYGCGFGDGSGSGCVEEDYEGSGDGSGEGPGRGSDFGSGVDMQWRFRHTVLGRTH
jgi:hypothetical protein